QACRTVRQIRRRKFGFPLFLFPNQFVVTFFRRFRIGARGFPAFLEVDNLPPVWRFRGIAAGNPMNRLKNLTVSYFISVLI
ncbi:hypothetical protein QWW45_10655, partial [Neisseria gonorrhoeae]